MNDETPSWAAAAWGQRSGQRTEGLSTERIVAAAIELADREGLAGLSIRKLGQHLGAGTMAAYRHVQSREDLVILMVDVALGPPPADIRRAASWQEGLERWASGMSLRYGTHPWLIDAAITGFPATPNKALWLEYVLQVLAATGLDTQRMLDAALLVDGHARNTAYLVRELGRSGAAPSTAWLVPLLDPEQFPQLSRVLVSGELEDETEQTIDFGLARIIAGLEALVDG
ncbi:MAG: tetracyclin repressor, C-terminal all-alpha domain protein [Rhodoglobus sp.]|nr:tetracyclin repressor, C-terminal all-alpha domain protein [Rhodoglobus sp.]